MKEYLLLLSLTLMPWLRPGYSNQLPGYLSTEKSLLIPGYPGSRYSALDTLITTHLG